jgi:UDP-N-acetylmuramoylalanine--D-glutamate ligase
LNADDRDVAAWPARGQVSWFGSDPTARCDGQNGVFFDAEGVATKGFAQRFHVAWTEFPRVRGSAMQRNVAAAIATCLSLKVDPQTIIQGLENFVPLPHRFESLGRVAGRFWINDSKATTPEAAIAAVRSCESKPWVVLGGASKDVELRSFCESIATEIRGAALLGETSAELQRWLSQLNPDLCMRICSTIEEAVHWLSVASADGDTVLLSPACSSLDQFRDYADRGNQFREAVMQLAGAPSTSAMPAA